MHFFSESHRLIAESSDNLLHDTLAGQLMTPGSIRRFAVAAGAMLRTNAVIFTATAGFPFVCALACRHVVV